MKLNTQVTALGILALNAFWNALNEGLYAPMTFLSNLSAQDASEKEYFGLSHKYIGPDPLTGS